VQTKSITWFVLAALLFCPPAAYAEDLYLALHTSGEGQYLVEGRFWTPADAPTVWSTLSDYDHLPSFVLSLKTSKVQERSSDSLLIDQVADGRALLFFHRRIHVRLQVHEHPFDEIVFEDISHRDFVSYSGSWHILAAAGGGSWVDYRLQAKPNFFAPGPIARQSFQKMAKELLMSVESEIVRRGHLDSTFLCCSQHSEKNSRVH